jgi:hypothetical protein
MRSGEPTDDGLVHDLRSLFDEEVRRARDEPPSRPDLSRLKPAPFHPVGSSLLIVVAGVALGLLLLRSPESQLSTGAEATPTAVASPSETAAATVQGTPGPLTDGVPTSFGGEVVLRGGELEAWISASTDDASFLAGGWWHKGEVIRACPNPRSREVVSCILFELYQDAEGGEKLWVAPADDGLLPSDYGHLTRPVVLRLHTHDLRCSPDDPGCEQRSVLLEVLWLGPPS